MIFQLLISTLNYFTIRELTHTLEDRDYQKGSVRTLIHEDNIGLVEVGSQGFVVLVQPTYFGDWQDETATPYPTKQDLIDDLRSNAFVQPLTWEDITGDPNDNQVLVDFVQAIADGKVEWKNVWDSANSPYDLFDMVYDDGWTMIANKETTDRPSPQPTGAAFNVYDGGAPTFQVLANQIVFGNRYTFNTGGYLNGWRIFTLIGNNYEVYSIIDPLGANEISLLASFEATAIGWRTFTVVPTIIRANTVFDIRVIVREPSPTPTIFNGNWDYTTPNPSTTTPLAGQIVQPNTALVEFRISKTDNDAGDRSAELATLVIGDQINGLGSSWSIQGIIDFPTYITFLVAPASQAAPDGVANFVFETVTPTPITFMRDVDYWLTSPYDVNGLYVVDQGLEDVVLDDTAYGVDIQVQAATVSDDWDLVSTSGVTGGGGDSGTVITTELTAISLATSQEPVAVDTPLRIEFGAAQGTASDPVMIDATGLITFNEAGIYNIDIRGHFGRLGGAMVSELRFRGVENGSIVTGVTVGAKIENPNIVIPLLVNGDGQQAAGDTVEYEMIRDSSGNNSGGLFELPTTLAGWGASPCVLVIISRYT